MIVKAKDFKKYTNCPLHALVHIFTKLETNGITLFEGTNQEVIVHIILLKILGDNLGLHLTCGFQTTFRGNRPCMTCEITWEDLKTVFESDESLIRTIEKYEKYFEEGTYIENGVVEKCVLNEMPTYHVVENKIFDTMHDIDLGVIDAFNNRIQNFDYGYIERPNMPSKILPQHIKNGGKLHLNANEAHFFLKYFPLLAHSMIPYEDPTWWIKYIHLNSIMIP
uniref:Uncharacterized protein n=1 Tax=Megaselia scalaris TaxID=36166 RepID=T1H0G4_MEGSC